MSSYSERELLQQVATTVADVLVLVDQHNARLTPGNERYLLTDVRLDALGQAAARVRDHLRSPVETPAPPPPLMLNRTLLLWRKRRWPLWPKLISAFPNREAFVKWVGTMWAQPLEYVTVHDAATGQEAHRYTTVADLMAAPLVYLQQPAELRPKWTTPANARTS